MFGERQRFRIAPAVLLLAAASLFLPVPLRAQEPAAGQGGIRGVIYDADYNLPVPAVRVTVVETSQAVLSGEDGHFRIPDLPPGGYTVVFASEGFQRETRAGVIVIEGRLTELEVRVFGAYTDLEELIVEDIELGGGTVEGLLKLREQSVAMMDAVGADMMSRAGAGTAAAALKLVTGTTVQDGKYAVIRGLSDRYTSSMLNGVRLPTADKDRRAVQMDQFPSAMIENIQVTKTFMPDLQGEASGGGINIVTKSVPDKRVLSASVSVEYDTEATGNEGFLSYLKGGNRLGGMRGMMDPLFWQTGAIKNPRGLDQSYSTQPDHRTPGPNYGLKFAAGDSWNLAENLAAGLLLNGSYSQKYKYRESVKQGVKDPSTVATNTTTDPDKFVQAYTSTDEQLWSVGLTAGVKSERHELKLTGIYTHLARDVVDVRYGSYDDIAYGYVTNIIPGTVRPPRPAITNGYTETWRRGRDLKGTVMQYTENGTGSAQLTGKHTFELLNDATLDWTLAYNAAESDEPDRRAIKGAYQYNKTVEYDKNKVMISSNETSEYTFDEFQRRWHDTREAGPQGQVNFKQPFAIGAWEGYLKGGLFGDYIDRTFRNRAFYPEAEGGGLPPVPADDEYDFSHFGTLGGWPRGNLASFLVEYDSRQEIEAWYLMGRVPLPEWLDVVGGVRVENTLMQTRVWQPGSDVIWLYGVGRDPANPLTYGAVYYESNVEPARGAAVIAEEHFLPALSLTLKPLEGVSLRASYGETIARPTFKELTPVLYQEFDSSRIFLGNPSLGLSRLKNYDLRIEWRPGGSGDILAASYFYKSILGPIQHTTYKSFSGGSEEYIVPENYTSGQVNGVEIEARKDMGFVWSGLAGLVLGANATMQSSTVAYSLGLRQALGNGGLRATGRPMDNQPDLLYNLNVTYEYDPWGLTLGLFYNHKGELYTSGESWSGSNGYVPNQVDLPVSTLDFSMGIKFAKVWRLGFEAKNLLDPEIESVHRGPMGDLPNGSYRQGRTFSASLGCSF